MTMHSTDGFKEESCLDFPLKEKSVWITPQIASMTADKTASGTNLTLSERVKTNVYGGS